MNLPLPPPEKKATKYESNCNLLNDFVSEYEKRNNVSIAKITYTSRKLKSGSVKVKLFIECNEL